MDEKYDDRVSLSENATRFIKKRISDIGPTLDSDDSSPYKEGIKLKPTLLTSIVVNNNLIVFSLFVFFYITR